MKNTRVLLKSRPQGWVAPENFEVDHGETPDPDAGQLLLRNIYLSVDPYMRGRMNDVKSYVPPFGIGEPLQGGVVSEVVAGSAGDISEGDYVVGMGTWENYSLHSGEGLNKVDKSLAPLSYYLGILGMPGMTAWVGLKGIAECGEGENLFVSAASGAVGSVVGQIGKNLGCHVAGSAGSDEKVAFLTDELGFDAAFNYKTAENPMRAIASANPEGIDVLFENVGGPYFEAAIGALNQGARIALCGMISAYNATMADMPAGPRNLFMLIQRKARMEGFIVSDHPELCAEWVGVGAKWLSEGKLKYRESVAEGIEKAPEAFIGMLKGENFGKQLVRLGED